MASRYQSVLKEVYVTVNKHTALSGLLMGAGFYHAISNSKYAQIPLVAVIPNVYAGYQGLKYVVSEFKDDPAIKGDRPVIEGGPGTYPAPEQSKKPTNK